MAKSALAVLHIALAAMLLALHPARAAAANAIAVVAAENFYGDVARQIGGSRVEVTSALNNPSQDPHLFEASPSVARAVSRAQLIVLNGIDYDPWMERLVATSGAKSRVIVVARLAGKRIGDNPHIWYDPRTMALLAGAVRDALAATDSRNASEYRERYTRFMNSLTPLLAKITQLRQRLKNTPVAATEPVFQYMCDALGFSVMEASFQRSIMNNTEPSPSEVAAFESDLKAHRVRLLLYNSQASGPVAENMKALANTSGVPVVGVTETEPQGMTYQAWLESELDAVSRALK